MSTDVDLEKWAGAPQRNQGVLSKEKGVSKIIGAGYLGGLRRW